MLMMNYVCYLIIPVMKGWGYLSPHLTAHASEHPSTPQEYGLTVGYFQRYKIPAGTCTFGCLLIILESAPADPTMREWRNWQTRET